MNIPFSFFVVFFFGISLSHLISKWKTKTGLSYCIEKLHTFMHQPCQSFRKWHFRVLSYSLCLLNDLRIILWYSLYYSDHSDSRLEYNLFSLLPTYEVTCFWFCGDSVCLLVWWGITFCLWCIDTVCLFLWFSYVADCSETEVQLCDKEYVTRLLCWCNVCHNKLEKAYINWQSRVFLVKSHAKNSWIIYLNPQIYNIMQNFMDLEIAFN